MMEQAFPFLILKGLTKSDRVIFDPAPLHQEEVLIRLFHGPLQLV